MGQCSLHVERLLTFLPLVKRAPVRLEEPLTIVNNRCMYADVAGEATWVRKRMREGRGEQVWLRTLTLVPLPLTVLFGCCWRWPAGMQSGGVKRQTAAERSRAEQSAGKQTHLPVHFVACPAGVPALAPAEQRAVVFVGLIAWCKAR